MTKHIRRYDQNHLILGDHYNGNMGIPRPVLKPMQPYVGNTARGWGFKDPWDEPYQDFVGPVAEFNKRVYEKVR